MPINARWAVRETYWLYYSTTVSAERAKELIFPRARHNTVNILSMKIQSTTYKNKPCVVLIIEDVYTVHGNGKGDSRRFINGGNDKKQPIRQLHYEFKRCDRKFVHCGNRCHGCDKQRRIS